MVVDKPRLSSREQLVRFLLAGLPSFALAFPLNYLMVEYAGFHKALAYGIVLICQVVVNFFTCYFFVFQKGSDTPLLHQLWQFIVGIIGFRCGDWAIYSIATTYLSVPYLLMQIANVSIFALLKFGFAKKIMGEPSPERV